MASETASSVDEEHAAAAAAAAVQPLSTDKRGKHRIVAELKRLQQDSKFLEFNVRLLSKDECSKPGFNIVTDSCTYCNKKIKEELEELEKTENMSTICMDLLKNVESRPDPLLPEIHGPVNLLWDRWFEGPQDPDTCRCLIL